MQNDLTEVDEDLAKRLVTDWHKMFCPNKIKWADSKSEKEFRWESIPKVYSEGDEAFHEYKQHQALEYFIFFEDFGFKNHSLYVSTCMPFESEGIPSRDCYVFPKNLAWTMAFTHEYGWMGPYFVHGSNYDKKCKENLGAVKARLNGWA